MLSGSMQDPLWKFILNKLFDVLGADNEDSLKFYEEWVDGRRMYVSPNGDSLDADKTDADFAAFVKNGITRMGKVIKDAKITAQP